MTDDPAPGALLLLLIRHAKAERHHDDGDHARGLTARGRRDAAALGRWVGEQGLVPDLVVTSDAVRARETWTAAASELDDPPPVRALDELYDTSVDRALDVVSRTLEPVRVLALVGHEPTTSELALALAGETSDGAVVAAVRAGMPTSSVAVVRLAPPWAAVAGGAGVLERHEVPRGR